MGGRFVRVESSLGLLPFDIGEVNSGFKAGRGGLSVRCANFQCTKYRVASDRGRCVTGSILIIGRTLRVVFGRKRSGLAVNSYYLRRCGRVYGGSLGGRLRCGRVFPSMCGIDVGPARCACRGTKSCVEGSCENN